MTDSIQTSSQVWLSLGSNEGDRRKNLLDAIDGIRTHAQIQLLHESTWYETEPWGFTDQPVFYNLVVEIETDLGPLELLNTIKAIETQLGREDGAHWGPRLIDIDIILFGDSVFKSSTLEIPHPFFRERAFVLVPLSDLGPDIVDPVTKRSIKELLDEVSQPLGVKPLMNEHKNLG
jgi:2-amino-4-hydroxy-6-hydroxymethyldihydropteridine diphosphokinase